MLYTGCSAGEHGRDSYRFARILRLPEHVRALMQADIERRFGVRWSEFEVEQTAPLLTQPALIVHDAHDDQRKSQWDADNPIRDGERYARHWPGAAPDLDLLQRLDAVDYRRRMALVAVTVAGSREVVVAHAEYVAEDGRAELAMVVADGWQRRGLGSQDRHDSLSITACLASDRMAVASSPFGRSIEGKP